MGNEHGMNGIGRGANLFGMLRNGSRNYDSRPPANCRRARAAWDRHLKNGPIVTMHLLDGYWGAQRPNGDWDEIENHWPLDEPMDEGAAAR